MRRKHLWKKIEAERQRLMATGIQVYSWSGRTNSNNGGGRVLVPLPGNIYVQDLEGAGKGKLRMIFDQSSTGRNGGAIDAQLSPDSTVVGFVQEAEIYVVKICNPNATEMCPAVQITTGARGNGKMNGLEILLHRKKWIVIVDFGGRLIVKRLHMNKLTRLIYQFIVFYTKVKIW